MRRKRLYRLSRAGRRGLAVPAVSVAEKTAVGRSFYDFSADYWTNFARGPRPLAAEEASRVASLRREVEDLAQARSVQLETELLGLKIPSPIGVAAGPAPNSLWIRFFAGIGYDLLTYKTVRDRFWQGYPLPNLLDVEGDFTSGFRARRKPTGTITNSLGMPSPTPEAWRQDLSDLLRAQTAPLLVVSVTATVGPRTTQEEMLGQFAQLARSVKALGAPAVELNLSCPNIQRGEGEIYADAKLAGQVVASVRGAVGGTYPLFLKLGFLESYAPLVRETYDSHIAYVVINSIRAPVHDEDGRSVFPDRGNAAGICGDAIAGFALRAVADLAALRRPGLGYGIVGVGGVRDEATASSLLRAGADVIECATGALYDPALAWRIKRRLLEEPPRP